jgi:FXSXX-COOH protein
MEPVNVDPGDAEPVLPDVTRLPLTELLISTDSVLANALRRVVAEMDEPTIVAGFGNIPR